MKRKAVRPEAECGGWVATDYQAAEQRKERNVIIPAQIFRHILLDAVSRIIFLLK